jgi:hypothetical protein
LLELYAARGVLENAVLPAAVAVAGPDDHVHVRAVHDALDRAVRTGDLRADHQESRAFHLALLARPGCHGSGRWSSRRGTSRSPTGRWPTSPTPPGDACTTTTAPC